MHVWQPGGYLVQSYIYWGFLICILTGMRPGEVGQIKCADIRTDNQFFYFDLRPFDARSGRVALQDLRNLKTNAAGRVIPVHPLLIELGLLERMQELMDKGEERLFPEWHVYVRKDGTQRWSQPLSKSWQYAKKLLKLSRADLALYSTRHLMADWLDSGGIAQQTRDRILAGAGLSVLPDFLIMNKIRSGRLVHILPTWTLPAGGIHAVYPAARFRPRKVTAFVEMLMEEHRRGETG